MKVKYSDIEMAFSYVSSMYYGANEAFLLDSGEILWRSEYSCDTGEIEDVDTKLDNSKWISIPHKNDLELGKNLVFEFVEKNLPDSYDRVRRIFSKRGAYGRYKDFLDDHEKLELWYEFENTRTESALREWCRINDIELED